MAPKSKSGVKNEDLQQEDILQAVVFADSFNRNFSPVSDERPRALFPVANSPLLEYTLEFLCSGGVQEVFVVCCHHADQIKEHLRTSRWNEKSSSCSVVTIVSDQYLSMGDALRDIDAKNLIRSDFVLVYGDLVSNIKLQNIIQEHKARKEKDKSAVMTMVFRQASPGHMTRYSQEEDVVVAIDNTTQNIIHYQKIPATCKRIEFPVEILTDHKDTEIRYDLLDANISICSPQVIQLFTDNFDYENRDSFVRGILINEEIMGNSIQMHVVSDAYAARICNLPTYDAVSQDILNRWSFPFVPDYCQKHNKDSVTFGRHNVYLSKDVTLARESQLTCNVLLGSGTSVDSNSVISDSIIGRNCKIGKNVTIKRSYLWDNVTVEDNCTIEASLLCDNVVVYEKVQTCPGCVLGSKVKVGPSTVLKSGTIAVSTLVDDDDFGEDEVDATNNGVSGEGDPSFGSKSHAFTYSRTAQDDDDSDEEVDLVKQIWGLNIESDSSDAEDDDSDKSSESGSDPGSLPGDGPVYYTEMLDTIQRAKDENISSENLILEINSLKHAYNISIKELTTNVVKALLQQPLNEDPSLAGVQALKVLKETLNKHLPVLKNYIKNEESQLQCLLAIEEFGGSNSHQMALVMKLIHFLYDEDLLMEQVIVKWYRQPVPQNTHVDSDDDEADLESQHVEIRKQVAPFIQWLEEADEESSEEDD